MERGAGMTLAGKKVYKGTCILAAGMVTFLCIGLMNTWSVMKAPFAEEFGWNAAQLSLNFSISFIFFCLGGLVGSYATKYFPHKMVLLASAALILIGEWITSHATETRLLYLYIGNGTLFGLGVGIAYNAIISAVYPWFAGRTGVCSGLLMMSYGFSSMIFSVVAEAMIHSEKIGWRNTYLALGLMMALVLIGASYVIKPPAEGEAKSKQLPAKEESVSLVESKTTREMIRSKTFVLFFFFLVCLAAVGNSFMSFARDYAMGVGLSAAVASAMVGVCSVSNGIGRVLTGLAFDRVGRRVVMLLANLFSILAVSLALLAVTREISWLGIVAMCLLGASFGCCPVMSMTGTSSLFGPKYYASNLSVANFNVMIGTLCATITGTIITKQGHYIGALLFMLSLSLTALVLNMLLNGKREKEI